MRVELEDLVGGWRLDALCIEYPDVEFFAQHGQSIDPAREVCDRCLVRRECLSFAMGDAEALRNGVWGGTSPQERKALRKRAA